MRIQQGSAEALAALYDEASPLVFSMAMRIVENRADAEEVTIDVFAQVWKNAGAWNPGRGTVNSWLILMARSRALDKLRWRKARTRLESPAPPQEKAQDSFGGEALLHAERRQRVQMAMQALSEAQRVVLDLAFFGGLTHQEIAEQLDEPLGTVKSRIRTAMLKMKEVLST